MKRLCILLALGAVLFPVLVFADSAVPPSFPPLINYQGMLTDAGGTPINGTRTLIFRIYDDTTGGGTVQWSETQSGVQVDNGLFNVVLGKSTALNLAFDKFYWLEVEVEGETMPRIRLTSVAYAYRAQKADTAEYAIAVPEGDLDDRYVNVNGPDSVRGSSFDYMLRVKNYGTSGGIYLYTPSSSGNGIYIDSAGRMGIWINNIGDNGIYLDDIHEYGIYMRDIFGYDGIRIYKTADDGISMDKIGDDGIEMGDVAGNGIYMVDVEENGIYINDAARNGLNVRLADYGVYIDSTRAGMDGVWVRYAENDGIRISHADDKGVFVSDAGGDGLYVYHADRYGLYIYDSDDDGIRVASADGDGIQAYGATGGGEIISLSASYYGLRVHSYNDLSTNGGLYVFGWGHITGGWSKSVSGSSGDVPAFSVCSPDVELIASGTGTLVAGQAQIAFEPEFQEAISSEVPVRVVVTAQDAPSTLLYVTNKSTQGFTVKPLEIPELSLKTDNVSFDWIAIGRQKGYEQRPEVVMGEEEWSAEQLSRDEEMGAEELKHQKELKQEALYRQEMIEKQARKEAERKEREREEQSTD